MHLDIGIRFSNMMSCDSPLRLLPHMIFWKYATLSMLEYHYVSWSPKMKYTPTGAISSLKVHEFLHIVVTVGLHSINLTKLRYFCTP
jgi:hypothetical protein